MLLSKISAYSNKKIHHRDVVISKVLLKKGFTQNLEELNKTRLCYSRNYIYNRLQHTLSNMFNSFLLNIFISTAEASDTVLELTSFMAKMINHQIHSPREEIFNGGQKTLKQRHNLDCSNSTANQFKDTIRNLKYTSISGSDKIQLL